jgi:transposase|tara:strand:- start:102 stop:554 length:453 start_codon:yes stop_codon:yes gene_type:complete
MNSALATLADLNADELREMVSGLLQKVASNTEKIKADAAQIQFKQALIDKLTYENAVLKRLKFGLKSERMNAEQRNLLNETLDADLAAVADEIALAQPESAAVQEKRTPKRQGSSHIALGSQQEVHRIASGVNGPFHSPAILIAQRCTVA